jgi:hypothetical protein
MPLSVSNPHSSLRAPSSHRSPSVAEYRPAVPQHPPDPLNPTIGLDQFFHLWNGPSHTKVTRSAMSPAHFRTELLTGMSEWKQWQCEGSPVTDRYVNYAEGFSVAIPAGLQGRRGQAAGPERGVSIPHGLPPGWRSSQHGETDHDRSSL